MFVYSRHPRKRTKISHLSERPSNFRSKSLLKAFSLSGTAGNRSDNSVIDSSSLSQMGHTDTPACTVWKWVMKEKIKTVRKKDSACTHSVVVLDRNNIKTSKILVDLVVFSYHKTSLLSRFHTSVQKNGSFRLQRYTSTIR